MKKHDIFLCVEKSKENEENMKIKDIIGVFAAAFLILFSSGCATDYRAEAAENAREYLLKNMEGLSVLQQNYIRYNDPIILNSVLWNSIVPSFMPDAHIIARHERNVYKDPRRDMLMQCFGWRVPGMDKDIFVVGTAQRDFRFWEVNRIVLRSRNKENLAGMRIRKKAMLHAITSNPDLKGKIFHKVRYAEPEVHTSMFILDQPKKQQNSDSWMDFLKMNHIQEPLQISAVWDDPATKKKIVIVGISSDEKLEKWMPLKAVELTEKEAKIYLGSKYTVYSDDSEDPFSPEFGKKKKTNDMSEPE